MREYNGFTPEQRREAGRIQERAFKQGIIQRPRKCKRCGQEKGIIDAHLEDYNKPLEDIEPLCYRCHMIHHVAHNRDNKDPDCARYWAEVAEGKQYPPMFRRDISILGRDHGIKRGRQYHATSD
jgi:hypothetical protein